MASVMPVLALLLHGIVLTTSKQLPATVAVHLLKSSPCPCIFAKNTEMNCGPINLCISGAKVRDYMYTLV